MAGGWYLGLALVFVWNSAPRDGLISLFRSFLLLLAKFSFWRGDWALGFHSIKF